MRLEGKAKLGFFPTPPETLQLIPTWLTLAGQGLRRYFDPCAGTGEALARIAKAHSPAETYGIELSDVRAVEAKRVLTTALNTGYEYAVITDEVFSLILLNPPYDGEGMTGAGPRLEETFFITSTSRLVPSAALIYIVPHARLNNDRIARHLLGWYNDLRCFILPGEEYQAFKQVIVLGARKPDYKPPTAEQMRVVMEGWAQARIVTGYADSEAPENGPNKTTRLPVYAPMPALTAGRGEYAIPTCGLRGRHGAPFRFQYQLISDEDMLREADGAAERLAASREWRDLVPPVEPMVIRPAITPKKGHIAMQVSGGLLGTNLLRRGDGEAVLLKGMVYKRSYVKHASEAGEGETDDWSPYEDDQKKLKKIEVEQRFENLLTTLDASGRLEATSEAATISNLLNQYVGQLADVLQLRNVPRYDMKPEAWEWAVFDNLSRAIRLPGRSDTGLTDFQKHLAVALGRVCLAYGAGFVNAEMASGKSRIFLAIAEYLEGAAQRSGRQAQGAYPLLIVGPGVVTGAENWPKEIGETIPGAVSRVLTTAAKPAPKPLKVGAWLREHRQVALDPDASAFQIQLESMAGRAAQRRAVVEAVQAVSEAACDAGETLGAEVERALAEAFHAALTRRPPRRKGKSWPSFLDARLGGYSWLGLPLPRDEEHAQEVAAEYSLVQFVREYASGLLPHASAAIMSFETAKLGSGRIPAMNTRTLKVRKSDPTTAEIFTELVEVCTCSRCGAVVAEAYDSENSEPLAPVQPQAAEEWVGHKRRFCQAPVRYWNPQKQRSEPGAWAWDEERGKRVVRTHDAQGRRYLCGAPLFEYTALRRESVTRYAQRKLRGFFGVLGCDEVHKAKGRGTGVGWTLAALSRIVRYTAGLTGTLFGGYSTSIFPLFYRLIPEVRREFDFDDEQRWVERYGLLKRTFYVAEADQIPADGAFLGTKFFDNVSEKPGISPAIVGLGLQYCTFSSLKDVGLPLPRYAEEIVRLPLTAAMEAQMARADGSLQDSKSGLFAWALERQKADDGKGAISVWLNTAFNRPNALFRPESVYFHPRISGRGRFAVRKNEQVIDLPAVTAPSETLPKEDWLADLVVAERARGRRVLVYVRQTGTRDIQPRLAEILTQRGLRVGILRPSLAPARRGPWLKANAPRFDVLLTNARLVEVGLNLTMFATAVFFEVEWSLYVLWQAMRRLYRPGALKDVKLYFPVYQDTMEETALDLIGAKMLAAQCFYGDEVAGALVEDSEDQDILAAIVRRAVGELQVGRSEGIFGPGPTANLLTPDPEQPGIVIGDSPLGSLVAIGPPVAVAATLADLARERQQVIRVGRSRRTPKAAEGQLSMF